MNIHNTAIISKDASIAEDALVGPYSIINGSVNIGSGTSIGAHCVIEEFVNIGKNCQFSPGAVIGGVSQDKKFKGGKSYVEIGDNNIIREYVTVNRSSKENGRTIIGNDNLIMAYSHVAHDCVVGNNVVIANSAAIAGHVTIEDNVILGGLCGIHQFVRIGKFSILGGCSKAVKDIVPFAIADGNPARIYGLNSIGLDRAGFSEEAKSVLKKAFKLLFLKKLNISNALKKIQKDLPSTKELTELISFIHSSERGVTK